MAKFIIKGNRVQYGVNDFSYQEFIQMIDRNISENKRFIRSDQEEIKRLNKLKTDFKKEWLKIF